MKVSNGKPNIEALRKPSKYNTIHNIKYLHMKLYKYYLKVGCRRDFTQTLIMNLNLRIMTQKLSLELVFTLFYCCDHFKWN